MAIQIDPKLTPRALLPQIEHLFALSRKKILGLEKTWQPSRGGPVFTERGKYTARGWTEWTQGFQFGAAFLQFEFDQDEQFLRLGCDRTARYMPRHVSHVGVHDHGFNNVSTYGNLLRLLRERRIPPNDALEETCELALKLSGAIQAARWTRTATGLGFIYSFNGPHSLFIDTIRSLRSLAVGHRLGHQLLGEHEEQISLLDRLVQHARTTARFNIYYGSDRDAYDLRGRTAHECIFNLNDGFFRCPSSQQGFSPFTTWTRGLAWAICGFAEQLEYLSSVSAKELQPLGGKASILAVCLKAARATADFYIQNACADGIPMWDTGAPQLHRLGEYQDEPANPYNQWEPVDSSAATIAAQGLYRLGHYLGAQGQRASGQRYCQAALTIAHTLFQEPYLCPQSQHQGLILHSVYHRPNGWDYIPPGQRIPNGESSMWGDYHARELALLLAREARRAPYLTFFKHL